MFVLFVLSRFYCTTNDIVHIGRSTIVFYSQAKRFDIDSESGVCHVKCKLSKEYEEWSLALRKHRMYRLGSVWGHEESLDEMQKKGLRARSGSVQNNALASWILNTDYFVQVYGLIHCIYHENMTLVYKTV